MNRKPLLSSLLGGLLVFLLLMTVWVLAALRLTSAAASPLQFPVQLQSGLTADYRPDPPGSRIYELRLSIVGELSSGATEQQGASIPDSLKEQMSRPVPSATPRPPSATPDNPATETPADSVPPTPTGLAPGTPGPSTTSTPGGTESAGGGSLLGSTPDCGQLQITSMWIDHGQELRARVRNDNARSAYLTRTVFEWPDVPPPAYVDWMRFKSRYYNEDDHASPTISEGSSDTLKGNSSETWRADFDDEPDGGIYGEFRLSLTFEFPGWGSCVIDGRAFREHPNATQTSSPPPSPTPTPSQTPTAETGPSATWTATLEATGAPSDVPQASTATADPSATP